MIKGILERKIGITQVELKKSFVKIETAIKLLNVKNGDD